MTPETRRFILRSESIRDNATTYLRGLSLEVIWEIVIRPYKAKRTLAQNALMWMWLHLIAAHVNFHRHETTNDPYTEDDMHEWFKDKFLPPRVVEIKGETRRIRKSTAKLKVDEMSEYLNQIDYYCGAELELVLPHPADLWMEAMGRAA